MLRSERPVSAREAHEFDPNAMEAYASWLYEVDCERELVRLVWQFIVSPSGRETSEVRNPSWFRPQDGTIDVARFNAACRPYWIKAVKTRELEAQTE